jgi:predicted enzyme related to lactoylglutathione lyase
MQPGTKSITLMPIQNMSRAIGFYTKSLGAKIRARGSRSMRDYWAELELCGSLFWLVKPSPRESRKLAYTTFMVRNIRTATSRLQAKGVRFQKGVATNSDSRVVGPVVYEPFGAAAYFKDSEGNLLMLWQNSSGM